MLHFQPRWNHGIWKKKSTKETFYSALWSVFPSLQYPECSEKLFILGSFLKTRFLKVWWVSKCKTWVRSARIWEKLKRDWGEMNLDSDFTCGRWELNVWANWRTTCNCRFQELPQEHPALERQQGLTTEGKIPGYWATQMWETRWFQWPQTPPNYPHRGPD